ncbi:MAG: alcohol dehydrogenase [Bacteroidetes bacterium]|nr:MAG: alcohol dehydrogenase [Bacteroidota bacterium]
MKAIVFENSETIARIKEIDKPEPGKGEVLVKLVAGSLNRRDYWIKKGIYQGSNFPCTVGSDGAGIVEKTGTGVDKNLLNKEVIINPALNWGKNPDYHGKDFQILGLPRQGTFAEYVCVPAENLWDKPQNLSFEQASALPLAGLTAYRALFKRGGLTKGENVLITGIGGGVSMFLLKFALSAGAKVFVTSSSEKKIKKAIQSGATEGVLYTEDNWNKNLLTHAKEGFELIIDSAAGKNFGLFPSMLKVGGRIVNFGGTAGNIPEMTAAKLFWKQASVLGTTMGSPEDFANMIHFVQKHKIQPEIDKIFPFEDAELAFKHMESQEQFGKIVLKIA